jgi:hypothetical protein
MLRRIVLKYLWVWLSKNGKERKLMIHLPCYWLIGCFSAFRRKLLHLGDSSYVSGTNKQKPVLPSPPHTPSSSCSSQDFCTGVCGFDSLPGTTRIIVSLLPFPWSGLSDLRYIFIAYNSLFYLSCLNSFGAAHCVAQCCRWKTVSNSSALCFLSL